MNVISKNQRIIRAVRFAALFIIFSHFNMTISIKIRGSALLDDRDYNFKSKSDFKQLRLEEEFFNHIIDAHVMIVQIRNITTKTIILFKNVKVETLQNFNEEKCYHVVFENKHLTAISSFN